MSAILRSKLSENQLQSLVVSYGAANDPTLRDEIVLNYKGLVESVSRRFAGSGEPLEDLFQEGYIGLITAADLYDSSKGVKFSTYATHFVIGQIKHALRDRGKIIKEPAWLQELNHRLTRVIESLSQEIGRQPTEVEIAQVMHVSEETVTELLTTREIFKVSSLDVDPDDSEGHGSELELVKDDRYTAFHLPVEDKVVLETAVNKLKLVEQKVIQDFYYSGLTQTEIAKKLGISCNYVSHILRSGTRKLRRILTTEELMEMQMQIQLANRRLGVLGSGVDASVVDTLTGLYNRAYMEARLQEELIRASRETSQVAYVSVEITGLEDFGREVGTMHRDNLICSLGNAVRDHLRRCDIVGRIGEWTFALILPHTGSHAHIVVRRIVEALNRVEDEFLKKFVGTTLTLLIGFSVYSEETANVRDMMATAEQSACPESIHLLANLAMQEKKAA